MSLKNLRIIVIDNPYDQMSEPLVQELLPRVFDLKIKGYRSRYDYGVLPLDTSDFIATHFVIAHPKGAVFQPILSYKMLTLKRAKLFNLPFSPMVMMQQCGTEKHVQAVRQIITNAELKGRDVSYIGSLTIDPEYKSDKLLVQKLMDLFVVCHYFYSLENNISEGLSGATVRFKMSRLVERIGYKPLELEGEALSPIVVPAISNEISQFYYLQSFSAESETISHFGKKYWKDAIYLGRGQDQKLKKSA